MSEMGCVLCKRKVNLITFLLSLKIWGARGSSIPEILGIIMGFFVCQRIPEKHGNGDFFTRTMGVGISSPRPANFLS